MQRFDHETVMELVSASPVETEAIGERLGHALSPGAIVALTGELGAGKTCLVRGLVRGLGGDARATSPTFVLVNEYRGRMPVHHVDLYRVQSVGEALDLGLDELFAGDGVTIVEWADKLGAALPCEAVHVHIEGLGEDPRRITIANAPRGA